MNESVRKPPRRILFEQPVTIVQDLQVDFELVTQTLRCIVPMVQMDFDVSKACSTQFGDALDVFGIVFVGGVEKRMLRGPPSRITQAVDRPRKILHPALDARILDMPGWPLPHRLVMIANAQEYMHVAIATHGPRRQDPGQAD
jgi:hypothetical protein